MSKTWNRWLIYGIGVLMLAVGITMNTKTGMGVSPIVSVAYSAARIFGWSLGSMTFAVYCLFVAGEFLLRGKHYRWKDLLQLPFSLVFGELLDLVDRLVTYDSTHHSLAENLCFLVAAVVACGIGVVMTVNMQLVPNPGDGIVQALAERFGKEQGVMKNMFDTCCVALNGGFVPDAVRPGDRNWSGNHRSHGGGGPGDLGGESLDEGKHVPGGRTDVRRDEPWHTAL